MTASRFRGVNVEFGKSYGKYRGREPEGGSLARKLNFEQKTLAAKWWQNFDVLELCASSSLKMIRKSPPLSSGA